MTIFLLFTNDIDADLRSRTMRFLKNNAGCIEYIDREAPSHLLLNENFTENEVFKICNNYRAGLTSRKEDFVAVVTSMRHEGNWFSHYDGAKNIFVTTFGIADIFDDLTDDIYIATEVISNVIHSLSKLDYKVDTELVHLEPQGCVNDFCPDRNQIKLKMRSAMMCKKCFNRANTNMNPMELSALLKTLSQVRERMKSFNRIDESTLPDIFVDGSMIYYEINGQKKELITPPKLRAFYILVLKAENSNGLSLKDIIDKRQDFYQIYSRMRENNNALNTVASFYGIPRNQRITKLEEFNTKDYERFLSGNHGLLNDTKKSINQKIRQELKTLSPDYEVTLSNGRYKINLDRSKIHFIR